MIFPVHMGALARQLGLHHVFWYSLIFVLNPLFFLESYMNIGTDIVKPVR